MLTIGDKFPAFDLKAVVSTDPKTARLLAQRPGLGEDRGVVEAAGVHEDHGDADDEAEVAHPVDQEGPTIRLTRPVHSWRE